MHKVCNVTTFHSVGQTEEKCQDKLSMLAGLHIGQDGSVPNPQHTVPAAHLQLIWKQLHERYKTGDEEDTNLEPAKLAEMEYRVRMHAAKSMIPEYWLADEKTMGRITRTFKAQLFKVDDLSKVRRKIEDDRDPMSQANAPTAFRILFTRAGMKADELKEAVHFARWITALWVYMFTTWYVLTSMYTTSDSMYIELGHIFDMLAKFDQYVVHAPFNVRISYHNAKHIYKELMQRIFKRIRDDQDTWSQAYNHCHAWFEGEMRYSNAPVILQAAEKKTKPTKGPDPDRDPDPPPRRADTKTPQKGKSTPANDPRGDRVRVPKGYKKCANKPLWKSKNGIEFCFKKNCGKECDGSCGRCHDCNWVFCKKPTTCTGSWNHKDIFPSR